MIAFSALRFPRHLLPIILPACLIGSPVAAADLFDKSNLAAWCIVPFDAKKRSPEERAEMVAKMGIKKIAYDWRQEHVAEFEREILAYQKHGIEFFAFWSTHDEAFRLFEKYDLHPQIWLTLSGGSEATPEERVKAAATRLLPIVERTRKAGCPLGLYNHGGWGGEPENLVAVCEYLKKNHGADHVGIVYNLHHGHSHLDRLPAAIERMKPHLLCFNLNGMDIAGDTKGRKILPLGVGTEDVKVLRQIRASGYNGPVGILNHTDEDAEGRLLDNLDGLNWLVPQLDDAPPAAKPKYRTWNDAKPQAGGGGRPAIREGTEVASLSADFGKALSGGLVIEGSADYHTLPFSIECRAKLDGKDRYNILVACNPKSAGTHWELYTHAGRGTLALYMPGRGGDFDSGVNVCDGQWHNFVASVDAELVTLWVDGKKVLEKPVGKAGELRQAEKEQLAFGRLVEGGIGCDGILDDVRISRGVMKPRPGNTPRERMDNTLGLWDFDHLDSLLTGPRAPAPAPFEPTLEPLDPSQNRHWKAFVNRERVFDFYGKQALAFLTHRPLPQLIPDFPGMDGGQQGHWGNQNDQVTWKDGRWAESDHGNLFSGVFKGAGLTLPKGVCVRYDDLAAVFNPETLSFPVTWKGGFVRLNDARHGFMAGAPMEGEVVTKSDEKREGRYLGFYRHGKEVVFAYEAGGRTQYLNARGEASEKLAALTRGGPAQWPQWLETKGTVGSEKPFATDTLTIPFENPHGTIFFLTAHDFFEDGSAAVATMTGEVWLVRGIDETLETLRWKRFATGLHQPLGMKIVDGKIHVLGRDQITCLHDLNGDDEADYYECVTNAMQSSPGGHDFVVGLERDAAGNWYFTSGNQGLCRIDKAGSLDVLATGFRNPNGLGISNDGRFLTTSAQEGDWTPATSVFQVELGVNEGAHFGAGGPKNGQSPEPVLLYLPRGEDNSASSQAFISGEVWRPLEGNGNLVHLSSGGGSAWLVMREQVKGRWQAAAMKISGNFDSGVQCARFSGKDGALYVTGLQGWGTYTPLDGCFQRVRFTGGTPVPVGFETRENGVIVRFDQPVSESASVAAETFAQCWTYKYSGTYGSPEYSVRYPDTPGHDPLEVRSVQRLEGGRAIFVEIPQIVPAGQVHLRLATGQDLFLTVHALGGAYTDFTGYTKIPKTLHAAQIGVVAPVAAKPNPWAGGSKGRQITVEAGLGLQYVQKEIRVKAGERISLTFVNPDLVPHNWLLAKPGTLQKMGELCNLMIADPEALARHYVPKSDEVVVWTDMVNPKADFTIHFDAPNEKGSYPYLCTFPGHWMVMNGVLMVE
ncbi:MAG: TIM barrel protein [Verrucomicrobiales bacterium]|nr:TIM barrel protein [Verrucomicrobiales bacterium]